MKVLITGATSKVTISIKEHLESLGHQVFLTTSQDGSKNIKFDLNQPEASESQIDQLLSQGLDAVILSAATPTYTLTKAEAVPWKDAVNFLNANIMGNYWLLRKILPIFKQQKFGRIIFISSMCSVHPLKGYSVYAMAKSAVETLMKYIAHEYGNHNIVANTIRLGVFHTNRNDKYLSNPTIKGKIESSVSLKRVGSTKDLNPVIDMLIHPDCYVQGTEIDVAGGPSMPL
jgi:NAD(P)-dependent dehydrogenase (short-subunit alcohol dehydrogenase family)